MADEEFKGDELAGTDQWERWLKDAVTIEFFDTLKGRVNIIRDELEVCEANELDTLQGELKSLRFTLTFPAQVIDNQKETDNG